MSGGRQRTLPQIWRAPQGRTEGEGAGDDSDDDLLLAAAAAADPVPVEGFSEAAGSIWIYPTNLPVRPYQERMAGAALLANTLVCLPTGLGKTFVAAVVMYNFYRWFPSGKVLFLAPTKPLVAQQMEACARVMGIPSRDMAEMTGGTQALGRRELWNTKRVLFLTPQIMVNDLSRGTCPAVDIKCLVIDEAHKALGNHAYCQVVRELSKYTSQFRILALSATPGSDTKAVQQVISNLLIARIEVCAEDSPEIQPYSHERLVEKIVVPLGEELAGIQNTYIQVLEAFAGRLIRMGVLARRDIPSLTKYQIILARDQYRKNPSSQHVGVLQGVIEGDFALCISLYHGYELLLQMGVRSLFIYLWGIMDGAKGLTRTKNELGRNEDFMGLYQHLRDMFSDTAVAPEMGGVCRSNTVLEKKKEFIYSHPKLRKLEEIVIEHFKSWKNRCSEQEGSGGPSEDTRVMIFSSFRDSVQEIAEMLSRLSPTVRAMTFVGHSTGKSTKGFTQKEQLEVVRRFREGGYNTLVSTCVGEEGLDIGEVDLIVCFDAQRSPVRLVQRMGRTGRRRHGRIVVILAQGREERTYNQSQCSKRSIHKAISGNKTLHFYQHSPRMVPEGINPQVHKMFITAEKYEPGNSRALCKERRCSSLQHKSALFSCVTGQKQTVSHENWFLSPEEYETWDRLYRIKESDGIKEPVLPQTQFATLENLEEIPEQQDQQQEQQEQGAVQLLSLCEWSLWQSQPFPTALVGHSEPCHHFISLMEMMEQMRQEQGDCSYGRELQPHLHVEDVNIPGNKRHLHTTNSSWGQRARSSRKDVAHSSKRKPFLPDGGDNESELFTTFKITKPKPPRRTPGSSVGVGPSASPSGGIALDEQPDQDTERDEELEVTFDLNAVIDLCDSSDSTDIADSPAAQGNKPAGKAPASLGMLPGDSGYETSPVSSDLFYLPESYRDSLGTPSQEPPGLQLTLSRVQRLLSQSPPPIPSWNELEDLENMVSNEEAVCPVPEVIPEGHSVGLQDKAFSVSSEADPSLLLVENPKVNVPREFCAPTSPRLSKTASSSKAAVVEEEHAWNDSFDGLFDNEEFPDIQGNPPATTPPSNRHFVHRDTEGVVGGEQSIRLFEDEPVDGTGDGGLSVSEEPPAGSEPGGNVIGTDGERGSRGAPSERPCVNSSSCREQPQSRNSMETAGVPEQGLENEDLYDCSQELFSVTFDLGFSISDSDNEPPEENRNTESTSKANGASGRGTGAKSTEDGEIFQSDGARLETSPEWDCRGLGRRAISTPLPLQSRDVSDREGPEPAPAAVPFLRSGGRRTARGSPEPLPSALSTPVSRKGGNVQAIKRVPRKVFSSAREETPEVPLGGEVPKSPRGQNFGSSAVDSPLGRTAELEDTALRGSRVCPGTSSESEEEIVFQRKNRMKKNVLRSPDGMDDSDFEPPQHRLTRKRRHPPSVSESSDDSGDFAQNWSRTTRSSSAARNKPRPGRAKRVRNSPTSKAPLLQAAARQFLQEEAELSQHGTEGLSSDESDGTEDELSSSMAQFLNDEGEVTQALNDSEMQALYLESVRSPALGSRGRNVRREFNSSAIFSQIPEQDPEYMEDSFCVGDEEEEGCRQSGPSEEEEEEEECVSISLLPRDSFSAGPGQYLTRHRTRLNQARREHRRKPSRIRVLSDSSEEETAVSREESMEGCSRAEQGSAECPEPAEPPAQHSSRAGAGPAPQPGEPPPEHHRELLPDLEPLVCERLDLHPAHPIRSTSFPPAVPGSVQAPSESLGDLQPSKVKSSWKSPCGSTSDPACPAATDPSPASAGFCREPAGKGPSLSILADSREICCGAQVISSLRAVHGLRVQVCSLGTSDYIVSTRLAVERTFQSELQGPGNRNRLSQRLQRLQGLFQRVCVILETDRTRPGDASHSFQRTQYYDGVLSALVQAGIRILFSSCQEETAVLLRDLALLEHSKGAAIGVPTELEGPRRDLLGFYLSIPPLSYVGALQLCHCFGCPQQLANSSPLAVAAAARLSLERAEEIQRYLRHSFDPQLLPQPPRASGKGPAAPRS
ncbi:Fanconi anemia group M protein isoform X3 [Myiozetetes cayanensis]|uniref:Fanconi anemia group M protein isoform X3 n=1 Tax=Myiozetetes cayanensis TaxID=478635 RepID=UPI00215F2C6F|nr:Fanconi anemia group M protein isoform X3 [Myiozetetes cayanensis]